MIHRNEIVICSQMVICWTVVPLERQLRGGGFVPIRKYSHTWKICYIWQPQINLIFKFSSESQSSHHNKQNQKRRTTKLRACRLPYRSGRATTSTKTIIASCFSFFLDYRMTNICVSRNKDDEGEGATEKRKGKKSGHFTSFACSRVYIQSKAR